MKLISTLTALVIMVTVVIATHTTTLNHRLQRTNVNVNTIGCKCIMSKPNKQNTDATYCMCFNRKDGTSNETTTCRAYTDGVFSFCTDVTEGSELWQECVQHYCPNNGDIVDPPRNKIYF